jgi:hypothetical protein
MGHPTMKLRNEWGITVEVVPHISSRDGAPVL